MACDAHRADPLGPHPGRAASRTHRAFGIPTTTPSSSTTCRTTSARPTTWPPSTRRRSRSCGRCSGQRRRSTRCCRCWPRSVCSSGSPRRCRKSRRSSSAAMSRTSSSGMVPRIYNHSYSISADLVIPEGGAEGVIVAEADHLGGFSLFVDSGRLTHTYSMMGVFVFRQQVTEPLPTGEVTVRMEFAADARSPQPVARSHLFVNDKPVGKRPDGPHRPHPVLWLCRNGHRTRQRRRRRPRATPTARPSRSPARSRRSSSTSSPTSP